MAKLLVAAGRREHQIGREGKTVAAAAAWRDQRRGSACGSPVVM
jgi:hypothetical protein